MRRSREDHAAAWQTQTAAIARIMKSITGDLMRLAHPVTRGLRALFTRSQDDAELCEELRAFLDASIEAKMADGMPRAAADAPRASSSGVHRRSNTG